VATVNATALILRTTDWSESSKIATLWTREFGKLRGLAKGGRRLKSSFESGLDLLTVCDIGLLRKSSGSLDLITEARVVRRFPQLRADLSALYAGYYVAELLADLTEEADPHPGLFDAALTALAEFGAETTPTGVRLARFEVDLLRELGYSPALELCAACGAALGADAVFSPSGGGGVCTNCRCQDARPISSDAWTYLRALASSGDDWRSSPHETVRAEVRQILNDYVSCLLGRRPRLLPYLGS
jgi:DNA repair protein RecO (recombination protein O)